MPRIRKSGGKSSFVHRYTFSYLMMTVLSSSYYCCDLRTGCIILGVLEVVVSIIGAICFGVTLGLLWENSSPDDQKRTAAIILVVASIVCLVSGITLLIGVFQEHPDWVLAHLVVSLLTTILCLVGLFVSVLETPWYFTLIAAILMLCSLYHWLIAYSYYEELD